MVTFFFGLSILFTLLGCISAFFFLRELCEDHYRYNPFRLPWITSMALVQILVGVGIAGKLSPELATSYSYILFAVSAFIVFAVGMSLYRRLHPLMLPPVLILMSVLSLLILPMNVWEQVQEQVSTRA